MPLPENSIPGVEVLGPGKENLRFIIGIGVYALAIIALVVYLIWKLPRESDNVPQTPADEEEETKDNADQ